MINNFHALVYIPSIRWASSALVAALIVGLAATPSRANVAIVADTGNSESNKGFFTGSFSYLSTSSTDASLTFELTNTSPAANEGFLTAFAFNNPDDLVTDATLSSTNANFDIIGDPSFNNSINGQPRGRFDIGASTSNQWLGGGNPNQGIGVGETETFTFALTGTGLDTLTEQSFINALSTGGGEPGVFFYARFLGFEDGDSDKVPAVAVPEPSPLLLGLATVVPIAAVGYIRRRRRTVTAAA